VAADPNDPALQLPATPTPFIALPATQREFNARAARMQRSGRYQTLFHHSWLQPVADQTTALPIVLDRSGDSGQWPRLQGSVKLYLSRYLHLETNLWLNTPGDYLPGEWRMPSPPLGPPSLIIEEHQADTLDEIIANWEELSAKIASENPESPETAPQPLAPIEERLELEESGETQESEGTDELIAEEMQEQTYPYRHAILLKQSRRMRSDEVHYLDHPLLGVVIKLTPLTPEELQAIALAEAAAAQ
jgi:hypothetical protein